MESLGCCTQLDRWQCRTCWLYSAPRPNNMEHVRHWTSLCTPFRWVLRWTFWLNLESQTGHMNLLPSWACMWRLNPVDDRKPFPQTVQQKGLSWLSADETVEFCSTLSWQWLLPFGRCTEDIPRECRLWKVLRWKACCDDFEANVNPWSNNPVMNKKLTLTQISVF